MAVDGARVLTRRVTGRGWSAASPAATVAARRRSISLRLANPYRARAAGAACLANMGFTDLHESPVA